MPARGSRGSVRPWIDGARRPDEPRRDADAAMQGEAADTSEDGCTTCRLSAAALAIVGLALAVTWAIERGIL